MSNEGINIVIMWFMWICGAIAGFMIGRHLDAWNWAITSAVEHVRESAEDIWRWIAHE